MLLWPPHECCLNPCRLRQTFLLLWLPYNNNILVHVVVFWFWTCGGIQICVKNPNHTKMPSDLSKVVLILLNELLKWSKMFLVILRRLWFSLYELRCLKVWKFVAGTNHFGKEKSRTERKVQRNMCYIYEKNKRHFSASKHIHWTFFCYQI